MTKTISIQGEAASFHAIAAGRYFGSELELLGQETFLGTFDALREGKADYAVAALENSLFGSINEVYDLLQRHKFWICGEVYLRIEQCLIGLPDARIDMIREVHSHPVALAQCEQYLDTMLKQAERFEHHDTAGSVADIKRWADPAKAAIAGSAAAKLHGMKILAREIETNKQNYTRFVVLSREILPNESANKTSLILSTDHQPGALYNALGTFANRGLNLSKLQSRPIVGKAWHYVFYVDVNAGTQSKKLKDAIAELQQQNCTVSILGSYVSDGH